jgi:tetratricopeptide (TPR) repeat protein
MIRRWLVSAQQIEEACLHSQGGENIMGVLFKWTTPARTGHSRCRISPLSGLALLLFLSFSAVSLPGQGKASKPVGRPVPSVDSLVIQGKTDEAVRLAAKSPESARVAYQKLLEKVDVDITDRKIADAQSTLARTAQFLEGYGRTKNAIALPSAALKGRQLRIQGIQYSDQKEYQKATTALKQALAISKEIKDPVLEAGVHNNLGYALRNQEDLEEAAAEFDAARKLAEAQKDNLRAGSYNFNLGEVLLQSGPPEKAIEAFRRSSDQSKAAGRDNLEARAVLMQGVAQGRIDSIGPAPLSYFEKAQKMFEDQGDWRNAGWSYYLMADRTAYTQKFAEAAALGEKAIPLLVKAKDNRGLKACYFFLYDVYNKLGDQAKSEKYKKLNEEIAN